MAFGKLIREANAEFNGKNATARVLVVSDFESKCFNVNFEVVLSAYQQLKTLLGTANVATAKEISNGSDCLTPVPFQFLAECLVS